MLSAFNERYWDNPFLNTSAIPQNRTHSSIIIYAEIRVFRVFVDFRVFQGFQGFQGL
jgi:hypothetical protein